MGFATTSVMYQVGGRNANGGWCLSFGVIDYVIDLQVL